MPLEFFDIPQGTPEWYAIRKGCITASAFKKVMAKGEGKTRDEYMRALAAEVITGQPIETYTNEDMNRGKKLEPAIRNSWCMDHGLNPDDPAVVKQVGFVKKGVIGCSPDLLIRQDGLVEFKSMRPDLLLHVLRMGSNSPDWFPPEHRWQIQGNLWVTGRQWAVLCIDSLAPNMPNFERKIDRNLGEIEELHNAVKNFHLELHEFVRRFHPDGIPPWED
jgi:YqaJ-like viral recombinase domain